MRLENRYEITGLMHTGQLMHTCQNITTAITHIYCNSSEMNNMHNIYFTVELRYSLCKTYSKMQNILGYKKLFTDILRQTPCISTIK